MEDVSVQATAGRRALSAGICLFRTVDVEFFAEIDRPFDQQADGGEEGRQNGTLDAHLSALFGFVHSVLFFGMPSTPLQVFIKSLVRPGLQNVHLLAADPSCNDK